MFNVNVPLKIRKFDVLTKENKNKIILLWGEVPYWISVNHKSSEILSMIDNQKSFKEICNLLYNRDNKISTDSNLFRLFDILFKANIITYADKLFETFKEQSKYPIQYISFHITMKCNLQCKHCYINAGKALKDELTLDELKEAIDKIKPMTVKDCRITITGGEPTLRKDLLDILKYLKKYYIYVNMVTNGTLITDELAKSLASIDVTVQVSLDGYNKEIHENIRGKNTFEKSLNGIKILVKQGVKVSLSPMNTVKFFETINDYFDLALELGVYNVFLQPVYNVGRARHNNFQRVDDGLVIKKMSEFYKSSKYKKLVNLSLTSPIFANVRNLNRLRSCGTGLGTAVMLSNGDLYPCPNTIYSKFKIGNVKDEDLINVFKNSSVLKTLQAIHVNNSFGEKCANCNIKHFCGGGCRGFTYIETGDLYAHSVLCEYKRNEIEEILWALADNPELFMEAAKFLNKLHKRLNSPETLEKAIL